jgi:hypothetical protein
VANRAPGSGAAAAVGAARLGVEASLIARNEGGLACLGAQAAIEVACTALFSNDIAPTQVDCEPGYSDILAVDPRLCDPAALDVLRCANSPLLAPPSCGLPFLGALGAGCPACGPTTATTITWGGLKARYR